MAHRCRAGRRAVLRRRYPTPLPLRRAKWDLVPDVDYISDSIGVLSSGERVFLAAMVSFYSADLGGQLLSSIGVHGLSDISAALDQPRLQVLSALLLSYPGW